VPPGGAHPVSPGGLTRASGAGLTRCLRAGSPVPPGRAHPVSPGGTRAGASRSGSPRGLMRLLLIQSLDTPGPSVKYSRRNLRCKFNLDLRQGPAWRSLVMKGEGQRHDPRARPTGARPDVCLRPAPADPGSLRSARPAPDRVRAGPIAPARPEPGPIRPSPIRPSPIRPSPIHSGGIRQGPIRPGSIRPGPIRPGRSAPGLIRPGTRAPGPSAVPGPIAAGISPEPAAGVVRAAARQVHQVSAALPESRQRSRSFAETPLGQAVRPALAQLMAESRPSQ
jgi:hypothetical protein